MHSEQVLTASFGELCDATAEAFDEQLKACFQPDERLEFEVRLPAPGPGGRPPGVLVYISPKAGARWPEAWAPMLDAHHLAWVGARESGNEVDVARRVGLAQLAPAAAARVGPVDAARVFLAGFSGGGRVASMMLPVYPQRYAGALFICGANPLFAVSGEAARQLAAVPAVFLTGTGDFNLQDTELALATFQQAGVAGARLVVVDGLDHALPAPEALDEVLRYLTGGLDGDAP